jgi:dienelactone hydrolase
MASLLVMLSLMAPSAVSLRGEVHFKPTAAEAEVPKRFRLKEAVFPFEMEQRRATPRYTVWAVRFPSEVVTSDAANNTVHAEYFQPTNLPHGTKCSAVVVLHILGADFALSRYVAARLADAGVGALFVKLPYYGERQSPGRQSVTAGFQRAIAATQQGVCDVRRAASWLASRPEVDGDRLGVTGISLGGIVSAIAASVDPKLNRAVLLLAGGGLAEALWEMPESAPYRVLWLASGRTKTDFTRMTRPYDPVTYAHMLKGKHVLMMAGNVDEVIPPRATLALWEAAGKPRLEWFDCGHYSAVGYLLPGIRKTVDFFVSTP